VTVAAHVNWCQFCSIQWISANQQCVTKDDVTDKYGSCHRPILSICGSIAVVLPFLALQASGAYSIGD